MVVRTFGLSLLVTVISLVIAFLYGGPAGLFVCTILAILEISLSFDNAVMIATVLERMNPFWQKMFLTIGVLIAVFGMRVLFPLVIVWATADLAPREALLLALNPPDPETPDNRSYETIMVAAHPQIAALGGMFLLMIFLDYAFDDDRQSWGRFVEHGLVRLGRVKHAAVVMAVAVLLIAGQVVDDDQRVAVYTSGLIGMLLYLSIQGLTSLFDAHGPPGDEDRPAAELAPTRPQPVVVGGKAAFMLFLYLEMLDASFSFDGVIGAFAITSDPVLIALGLGFIGAMFVRSLTVYLVRAGTLTEYRYLENGAHWAIGALATILLVSLKFEVNEVISGLAGVVFIGLAMVSSIRANRADHRAAHRAAGTP
ncbi:MAG: DUF475 domain-containing protein [Gordonia sp. (in: high G+C Gram-positive bacteria)]|uniref:DUF475 domain-containing protein n=1 Tax=Gordonia sp. (in: high G+C Gram-positive bacteria) TaxID=84139 RepID=UPI003BB7FDCD